MKLPLLALALLASASARAADFNPALELGPICNSVLSNPGAANSQQVQLCKSAQASDETSFTNDNNARVLVPVAVVCYYSCALSTSGTPTVQKVCGSAGAAAATGGGGNPCTLAQASAKGAATADQQSFDDRVAKYGNLITAATMQSSAGPTIAGGAVTEMNSALAKSAGGSMPEACKRARATGNANDRIDCAVATNPNVPEFVRDPRFQAEFQQITGYSLQSVINKSESEISSGYATSMLKNIYSSLNGKASLASVLSTAEKAISTALEAVDTSAGNANLFATRSRGAGSGDIASSSPSTSGNVASSDPNAAAPASEVRKNSLADLNSMPAGEDLNRAPASEGAGEDQDLSLFVRASHRYRLVMDRVEKLDWDLPSNRN